MIASNLVLSSKRFQHVQFSPILFVDNSVSLLSLEEKINSNFRILTTFEPITWWLLILLLLIYSLFNVKFKGNILFNFAISLIDHIECLLTKHSKQFKMKIFI